MSEKKPRKARRNYEKELNELKMYCRIKIEVLESLSLKNGDVWLQHTDAYRDILARLEGPKQ